MKFQGAFVANQFLKSKSGQLWKNENPYDLSQAHFTWYEDPRLVAEAVEAARLAFQEWKDAPLSSRVETLNKFKAALKKRAAEFEEIIIAEAGKARWEAKQEVDALSNKIDISIQSGLSMLEKIGEVANSATSRIRWLPRGVCAVLGPFNFPIHLANGHIVPALLTGNTVIFKPSELTPACASLYAEAAKEAEFPPGVFQMLPGGAETGVKLLEHPDVRGVFFTGSYEVGKKITEILLKTREDLSVLSALEMGGKNATIVHQDADLMKATTEIIVSAYATAGQRCSSTSRVLIHESIYDDVKAKLLSFAQRVPYGDPADLKTFMGPLIHEKALQKFFAGLTEAKKDGFKPLLESRRVHEKSCIATPSIYESTDPKADTQKALYRDELFGPNMVLVPYRSNEELVDFHERTSYGLVASVFTRNESFFQFCERNLQVGLINWNRGTVGASSKLPFGGMKRSGNNWPAGLFSFFYCVSPQGQLLENTPFDVQKLPEPLRSMMSP